MQQYKEFDWVFAKTRNSPEIYEYIFSVHDKPVTEEEFVKHITGMPRYGGRNEAGNRRNKHRAPGAVRKNYRNLKEKFGFFPGA